MTIRQNCAIHFFPDAFGTSVGKIFGRQLATAGFLRAFMQHSGLESLYCCSPSQDFYQQFCAMARNCSSTAATNWISYANLEQLASVGCLFQPDPMIADLAWHRLRLGSTSLSLCGVTHTLCSTTIMDAIGASVTAPLEAWDTLVCTSTTAKGVVEHVLATYCEYLGDRFGTPVRSRIELPIIPFGVDCDSFAPSERGDALRMEVRNQLGMTSEDIAVLYVGRLSYHAKAHPLPMYTALEQVARRTDKPLHLLHFGWFSNPEIRNQFAAAAAALCPSVRAHFLDQRQDWSEAAWRAADIFVSLSDNLQETLGLTPLEAMAAGLPQVITDWNGYRDGVRHGVDGFLIPTVMPPAPAGEDLIFRHAVAIDNYDLYVGNTSQSIAVDMTSCVQSLERLVVSHELRGRMGHAGLARVRELFDWSVIIRAYQDLWYELSQRRRFAAVTLATAPRTHPLREDPFSVFSQYATCTLDANSILELGPNASPRQLRALTSMPMNRLAAHLMCSEEEIGLLVSVVTDESPIMAGDLLDRIPGERHATVYRTLGWLTKMDALRVVGLSNDTLLRTM